MAQITDIIHGFELIDGDFTYYIKKDNMSCKFTSRFVKVIN